MALSQAFVKLVQLSELSKQHALGLPSQEELVTYWSGIGFTMEGRRFVAPIGEISEVLPVPEYTKLPGVQTWLKGVANVRGRLMAVMDLLMFLHKRSGLNEKRRRLLVIDDGDLYSGLVVDEVLGMQHFPVTDFDESFQGDDDSIKEYVQGCYHRNEEVWTVFSLNRLVDDQRFMQASSRVVV